jgi:hypothetical protein
MDAALTRVIFLDSTHASLPDKTLGDLQPVPKTIRTEPDRPIDETKTQMSPRWDKYGFGKLTDELPQVFVDPNILLPCWPQ